jgi:hypothetical protein
VITVLPDGIEAATGNRNDRGPGPNNPGRQGNNPGNNNPNGRP